MFLSKEEIKRDLPNLIVDGNEDRVQEVCYDLCVGDEVYRSEEHLPEILSDSKPYVILHPGQFALVKTLEAVKVPGNMVGLISIRFEYKIQGLMNVSGFHVDPTYTQVKFFAGLAIALILALVGVIFRVLIH